MGARIISPGERRVRSNKRKLDGEQFRVWRTSVGMSQQAVAEKLGVTKAAVSQWERGEVGLPEDARQLLAGQGETGKATDE